jgi:hypothetical protein
MRALACAIVVVTGCHMYADNPPICEIGSDGVMLVNPGTLTCETFGPNACNPECGPCDPGATELPDWGKCTSPCRNLDEASCGRAPACRVARDYVAYYTGSKQTFAGCWPLGTAQEPIESCYQLDANSCARHNDCAALYQMARGANPPTAQFMGCAPESEVVGTCGGPIICTNVKPPSCPAGMQPGVQSGCFTGSCIPDQFCFGDPVPTNL